MMITALGQRIFVRFRKPIWAPTAPSKLFRIPEHKFYDKEESEQIFDLVRSYHAQEESIREYMKHEFYIPATKSGGVPDQFIKKEMEDDRMILEANDAENARIAKIKADYLENQLRQIEDRLMEEKLRQEELIMNTNRKVDEFITKHKANTDYFVTPQNIERKIDEAMENPVTFEFYIDTSGRKHGLAPQSKG